MRKLDSAYGTVILYRHTETAIAITANVYSATLIHVYLSATCISNYDQPVNPQSSRL